MKKILLFSFIALSTVAANAQVSVKDSIAAVKAAAKAAKAKQAQDLKDFKAKQAQDLKKFIEAQKNGGVVNITVPELKDAADSTAYIYGVATTNGLKQHLEANLKVDDAHLNIFAESLLERINADENNPDVNANIAGSEIGSQLCQMVTRISKDYYSADPGKELDRKIVAAAMLESLFGGSFIKAEDAGKALNQIMEKRKIENEEKIYGENKREGEKFIEENKTKKDIVTLPSGLQYKVIEKGNEAAKKATINDKVKVNYEGRLIDGTVFDSSYKRGEPTTFKPSQVIKGWTEALQLMPVGSKWELYIPWNLAYGERGSGSNIKPYTTLIFTIELLEIVE